MATPHLPALPDDDGMNIVSPSEIEEVDHNNTSTSDDAKDEMKEEDEDEESANLFHLADLPSSPDQSHDTPEPPPNEDKLLHVIFNC